MKDKCPTCGHKIEKRPVCWICLGQEEKEALEDLREARKKGEDEIHSAELDLERAREIALEIHSPTRPTKYICSYCAVPVSRRLRKLRKAWREGDTKSQY